MKHSSFMGLALLFLISTALTAQHDLPLEVRIENDRLISGGNETQGLYDLSKVRKYEILLEESNWFQLMDGSGQGPNSTPGVSLIGTLIVDDEITLDSVLISIKGQTSDFQNNSQKKSFKIEIDELKDQDLMGYDNLNLNCGFLDESSMREVLYYDICRDFTMSLKGCFADLYINGDYWGPYNNIQQIEGTYIREWFRNNDGTRWRAISPDGTGGGGPGGPGGPGGIFGTGVSTLNYNGPDSTDYNENYTLKKTEKEDPWSDLIYVCDLLNNEPIDDLYDVLVDHFDIDRSLWFLAQEVIFSDDDSYVYKGGMDYYVYWDDFTGRLMPLEVDGNTVMIDEHLFWSPFYREDDPDFPLMNRMLQNQEIRQRYLAHFRTILDKHFRPEMVHERIDELAPLIDQRIQDDPKKIYSYNQYLNGLEDLKDFVSDRYNFLLTDEEVDRDPVEISMVEMESTDGIGQAPLEDEEVTVRTEVASGAKSVMLYYGTGLDGKFDRIEMQDDGMHNDGDSNDNVYGATIPGFEAGTYVRYYVEAIKDDAFNTASYFPAGATHDVFIYRVTPVTILNEDIVINECMASNQESIADNEGEFDDWIELYNKGSEAIDVSGYMLSDDLEEMDKWSIPEGTSLAADDYLIIWADSDDEQNADGHLHANFKLSAGGESIVLSNVNGDVIDYVEFGEQQSDISYARIPNGTGDFEFRTETFGANNDGSMSNTVNVVGNGLFNVYPNPVFDVLTIENLDNSNSAWTLTFYNIIGQVVQEEMNITDPIHQMDISSFEIGNYILQIELGQERFVRKISILR